MFNFRLSFDSPGWLALLGLLPVLWWLSFRSLAALGNVRRIVAIALRSLVLVLVILALAELQWKRMSDRLTVIYVLDQSLSIPEAIKPVMVDYVRQEIAKHRDKTRGDRAGAIIFGGEPAIEHPPYDEDLPLVYNTETRIDREHTNLAAALRLAQATFPEDTSRRVVVLTDGNENVGDGLEQARVLAEVGDRHRRRADPLSAAGASGRREGHDPARYPPRPAVRSARGAQQRDSGRTPRMRRRSAGGSRSPAASAISNARLRTIAPLVDQRVTLEPGKRVFTVREQIDEPAFYNYEAEFIPDDVARDPIKQNKRATAMTHVRGKGQVLLIKDQDDAGRFRFSRRSAAAREHRSRRPIHERHVHEAHRPACPTTRSFSPTFPAKVSPKSR